MNMTPFMNHSRTIFLKGCSDISEKIRFINTCNAKICASALGNSFGLSIAEFSTLNKPIIVFDASENFKKQIPFWNDAFKEILGKSALYYSNSTELYEILKNFNQNIGLNLYEKYNPKNVMKIFKNIVINSYKKFKNL